MNYYNEIEPYCIQWLKNLMAEGLIPYGDVDGRPIQEVSPSEVEGYTQCHWFAGLGGWAYACRLAGWPDDREIWTGSCPCQPFSVAGQRKGAADARHLWPQWFRLIRKHHPPVIFGEQVKAGVATGWLDGTFYDLESKGYACAALVLPACSVGTPHQRDRIWFVAHANSGGAFWRDIPLQVGWLSSSQANAEAVPFTPEWAIKPAISPVADAVSSRMEQCRAYGNAIVPQVAAEVIRAYMEVTFE